MDEENIINRRGSLSISALLNEDTTDPTTNSQKKTKRKRISPKQYNRLMEIFDQTDTPSSEIRENLANELDMTKREVQVWFQNKRAKVNRSKNLVHTRRSTITTPPSDYYTKPAYFVPPLLTPQHQQNHNPSAIDLLASAAEYVRTDKKEIKYGI